jgi:hypothetical protein
MSGKSLLCELRIHYGLPCVAGGELISGMVAVAEGLKVDCMFGVKGGTAHRSGQSDRPVNCAIAAGNGSVTPAPLAG